MPGKPFVNSIGSILFMELASIKFFWMNLLYSITKLYFW
ncbi:hypothetical protein H175_ch0819 [Bacillus thuringiensis serovar thuringiensis str. IS5056]|nr:hypothetical protein CT43_CH0809 [Bacillus thuringiensis serovar chinensis CT-43]AGF99532.1 hypothetical protein H175_ch0819 [Bacillus thuringiensis serovar thuringiensis str. IS5056]